MAAAATNKGAAAEPVPDDVAPLFTPFQLGPFQLTNRMVYPPLTRCRALGMVPQPSAAEYYSQRAYPGSLLIAEGTIVARDGHGYPHIPGVYTAEQVEAWRPIVKAVKDKGSVFFCQIWHCGRASHQDYQEGGQPPVSSSAVAISSDQYKNVWTGSKMDAYPVPTPLDEAGIAARVEAYASGARNALAAGFDGVEIHGANGYLIDQFTKDSVNKRTDKYGGPIENRCRFLLEVVDAVVAQVGAERCGIRLSPHNNFLDATDSTPFATYIYILEQLSKKHPGLAYIHMVEPRISGSSEIAEYEGSLEPYRKVWKGPFIAAGGYTREGGAQAVASGHADLVAYGRLWIANPDLPRRFILNAPLNKYNRDTFYSQGMEGYIDYPSLEEGSKL